jgi:hypothetical protein
MAKGTQVEICVLKMIDGGNRVTDDITIVWMMGMPSWDKTSVGIHNEVGTLRIDVAEGPSQAMIKRKVMPTVKNLVLTGPISETILIMGIIGRITIITTTTTNKRTAMTVAARRLATS